MPIEFDSATFRLETNARTHPVGDVSHLIQTLDGIACAAIWAVLGSTQIEENYEVIERARSVLSEKASVEKSLARFFPDFALEMAAGSFTLPATRDDRFDPADPLDAGLQYGLNHWLKSTLYSEDREIYDELFSFAEISKLEHHSPLVIAVTVALGGAVAIPPALELPRFGGRIFT